MEETSHKLKEYINEISRIRTETPYDTAALKNCLTSFDLSDSEKDKLEEIAAGHSKRSEEMLKAGKVEGAIVSMERAVEIFPLSGEYLNRLAQLYLMRSEKDGGREEDRILARDNAAFALKLEKNNPISKDVLKEIQKKEEAANGREQNRKILIPLIVLVIIIIAALASQNRFTIPFLGKKQETVESTSTARTFRETETFTSTSVDPEIGYLPEDCTLDIGTSRLAKTNGSYSYTVQGNLVSEKEMIRSAQLQIIFKDYRGNRIYEKKLSLVKENETYYPGEPILVDGFFYIDYLPPDIDKITLVVDDLSFADVIPPRSNVQPLKIEWSAPRPEGADISMEIKEISELEGYSLRYGTVKLSLSNKGILPVTDLGIHLSWRDRYGEVYFSIPRELIRKDNPLLKTGETRIFQIFTELPPQREERDNEIFIDVNGIN